ncbi:MAG: helix-turn-helix transcriptional regulator [Ruminococcaceae bacterium]|nr:helix-turn-helix transcriptional regulator [Oscillospiraceae bacterium]
MFDMTKVAANIAKLRKEKGLTQMALADRLGISFQAVSNWERGLSMPDISKLGELSELFEVSIDEILWNKRGTEITEKVINSEPICDISIKEIEEVAPILYAEQVEELMEGIAEPEITAEDMASVAPFVSQNFIDSFARKQVKKHGTVEAIEPILMDLSDSCIDEIAMTLYEKGGIESIEDIAELLSDETIGEIAMKSYETHGIESIEDIAELLSDETIGEIAMKSYETHSIESIEDIAELLSDETIGEIAMKSYETHGIESIEDIAELLSDEALGRIATDALKKHGLKGIAPLLEYIDEDVIESYLHSRGL